MPTQGSATATLVSPAAGVAKLSSFRSTSSALQSQTAAQKALALAEETALKDYVEQCKTALAAAPHDPTKDFDVEFPRTLQWLIFLLVLLSISVFAFLSFEGNRSRLRQRERSNPDIDVESESLSESPLISNHWSGGAYQLGNRGTFDLKQRRVIVRTDPVYKHADLAEAVGLEDVEEIKLRFVNDEDVNKSRSYLIHTLAMSEKAKLSIARLEIAQLYIHCGADINIVKGWNGESTLMIAIHFNNFAVAELLVDNGADFSSDETEFGCTKDDGLTSQARRKPEPSM
ncbi:uncharacterized protein K441DRAFT_675457 [Cenococcum geophilum 1.58]|uniref:uncharacterized protein n=1 Tax=Cenococcum geophilum 1.58 TaxID=794803 RepID=UPI00358F4C8F|nr:hypothetical protein K441DRAFT_675457 [Cenococcum geophilum 1.58]